MCAVEVPCSALPLPCHQIKEQERRAEEQRLASQAADEEWRRQQHQRELQRKADEEARERELKVWCRRRHPATLVSQDAVGADVELPQIGVQL